MKRVVSKIAVLTILAVPTFIAAQSNCHDVSEDSHYSVVYENDRARVLTLELPRLASTGAVCDKGAYFSIVTTESRTLVAPEGTAGVTYNWYPGETRFHYTPVARTIRNETDRSHREVVVETFLRVQQHALNYDTDVFGGDLRAAVGMSDSYSRGGLTAIRVRLAPGETFPLSEADHVVIALTEISLSSENGKTLDLGRSDVTVLTLGRMTSLKNTSKVLALFMVVDF